MTLFSCSALDQIKEEQACIFDKDYKFSLNTKVEEIYKIFSEKNEKITIEIFPISPDYFIYNRENYFGKIATFFTNNILKF
ncbi:hypothetical protein DLH72_01975 [Candidatus Gracilibacteria bacterium]|nr:MAG: hypothetical protein DLH72_01975 [Candidatus Gracilibacteria bacterium]